MKYRAKKLNSDEWVEGSFIIHNAYNLHDGCEQHQAPTLMFIEEQDIRWNPKDKCWKFHRHEVNPATVCRPTGLSGVWENDYAVMEVWNGGDGIEEPDNRDTYEGIVVFDKNIFRWGLQTKCCGPGHIEVGLEVSQFVKIEVIDNIHDNPEPLK